MTTLFKYGEFSCCNFSIFFNFSSDFQYDFKLQSGNDFEINMLLPLLRLPCPYSTPPDYFNIPIPIYNNAAPDPFPSEAINLNGNTVDTLYHHATMLLN
jgi:hypothetical protein